MLMENGVEVVVNVQLAQIKMYYFKAMVEGNDICWKSSFSLAFFLLSFVCHEKFLSLAKFTEN